MALYFECRINKNSFRLFIWWFYPLGCRIDRNL